MISELSEDQKKEQEFLSKYDPGEYERPSIASDVLVFSTEGSVLKLLLIRRNDYPFKGKWCLPGSFIGANETAEEAASRTLLKETGMTGIAMEQLYTFSKIDRDPRMRIISVSYIAMVPNRVLRFRKGIRDGEAVLFDVVRTEDGFVLTSDFEEPDLSGAERGTTPSEVQGQATVLPETKDRNTALPEAKTHGILVRKGDIAFDHAEIIQTALDRMAGKIDYTDIGFHFLDDKDAFTLTDLRLIYNAVKGVEHDIGNFRRFIKNRYIVTGKIINNREDRKGFGRPAATYRYIGVNRQQPAK